MKYHHHFVRRSATLWACAGILLPSLTAQSRAPSAGGSSTESGDPQKMEPVIVTGSNIPTATDAVAAPVTIIGRPEIEQTGMDANVLEILRAQLPQVAGSYSIGNANAQNNAGATMGGSSFGMRSLPALVLINGRRVVMSGSSPITNREFVDVNMIPTAAIERIEVLTDGASAIYGADAMTGVINIILKTEFRSTEVGTRFAFASGGYAERSANLAVGAGRGPLSLTVTTSWSKTDRLLEKDRPFSRSITGRNAVVSGAVVNNGIFPNYILNPTLNTPRERNAVGTAAIATTFAQLVANGTYLTTNFAAVAATFDQAPYMTLLAGQEQRAASLHGSLKLLEGRIRLFSEYVHSETRGFTQNAPLAIAAGTYALPANAPYNPLRGIAFPGYAFRYLPLPRQFFNDGKLDRLIVGLRGRIAEDWTWETAWNWNHNRRSRNQRGVIYAPNFRRSIAGGYNRDGQPVTGGAYSRVLLGYDESKPNFVIQPALDPLARSDTIDPAALANVFGTCHLDTTSQLDSGDLRITGRLLTLPAGKIAWALGAETRQERATGIPDDNSRRTGPTAGNWNGATVLDPYDFRRRIDVGFVETRIPIAGEHRRWPGAHALDLTAAYRADNYSDVGRSRVPKYGLRWQPWDNHLTLRGTYSESFTPPSLLLLYGPQSQTSTASTVLPGLFGVNGQASVLIGNNPNLRPYTTATHSLGAVLSSRRLQGLTVTLDYSRLVFYGHEGQAGTPTILQSVNALGPQSPYASQVTFGAFPAAPGARAISRPGEIAEYLRAGNPAALLFVDDRVINFGTTRLDSLDVKLDYAVPGDRFGQWTLHTAGTFFLHFRFQRRPEQAYFEYAGLTTAGFWTLPGYRFQSNARWRRGAWNVTLGNTFVSAIADIGPGGPDFVGGIWRRIPVDRYLSWDLQAGCDLARLGSIVPFAWLKRVTVSAGINNLFDRMPPPAAQSFPDTNADVTNYSPIGRLMHVRARVKF